ncbi:hypothetical protein [Massilia glaciei]|uniref:hypothetical protein n=1 Tax=Massilia glaciei TaxID=1524097 RepID=UPI0015E80C1C|nr:hypothetical protein [Massilia glaciei]
MPALIAPLERGLFAGALRADHAECVIGHAACIHIEARGRYPTYRHLFNKCVCFERNGSRDGRNGIIALPLAALLLFIFLPCLFPFIDFVRDGNLRRER